MIAGRPGLARGCLVALDVAVTPELRLEGWPGRRSGLFRRRGGRAGSAWASRSPSAGRARIKRSTAALTDFGQLISQRVRAAKYEAAIGGDADAFEYASNSLPATFWLSPLLRGACRRRQQQPVSLTAASTCPDCSRSATTADGK